MLGSGEMPIYEYICESCSQVTEVLQKFSDDPLKTCPECGGKVGKLISMNSFHLKGGGWYDQGYSKESPKASASNGGAAPAASTPAPAATSTPATAPAAAPAAANKAD